MQDQAALDDYLVITANDYGVFGGVVSRARKRDEFISGLAS